MVHKIGEIIRFLEKSLDSKILDYSIGPLTAQGDNFGSTMVAMTVKIRPNSEIINSLNTVRF